MHTQSTWFRTAERFWASTQSKPGLFAVLTAALLTLGAWAVHRRLR